MAAADIFEITIRGKGGHGAAPQVTKDAYLSANIEEIKITKKFDGLPHRLIFNKYIQKIDRSNPLSLLLISFSSAWRYKQLTESSFKDLLKAFKNVYQMKTISILGCKIHAIQSHDVILKITALIFIKLE